MRASFQAGSIVRVSRKSGDCWRYRWRENGVQRSEWIGTVKRFPLQSQAEKAAERFRKMINSDAETITISDLIAKFLRECPPEREATAASYRSIFRRIEGKWGSLRIDCIGNKVLEIEAWLKDMTIIGRHPRKGYSSPVSSLYKSQVRNLFHLLVEKAMLWGNLQADRNPLDLVRLKGSSQRSKEIVILTVEQYSALLEDPKLPEAARVLIQLLAGLGLRISEGLGLKWTDCSFEERTISIQRSVVHGNASDTKTESSRQTLPLHANLIDVLRAWKAHETFKSQWVFCSERTGRPLDRDHLRETYLKPAGERIGVPGLGFHSFRHTYRAMQKNLGLSLEDQRNLMRHSRISTTIDTYGGNDNLERTRPANAKVIDMLTRRSA